MRKTANQLLSELKEREQNLPKKSFGIYWVDNQPTMVETYGKKREKPFKNRRNLAGTGRPVDPSLTWTQEGVLHPAYIGMKRLQDREVNPEEFSQTMHFKGSAPLPVEYYQTPQDND